MPLIPAAFKAYYDKHARWVPLAAFLAGFLFDAVMLQRIDEPAVLFQQAAYLFLSATLIGVELIEDIHEIHPPRILSKVWRFREALLHFMLGTLMNSYAIFYFKSASSFTSLAYIGLLAGLLVVNEFKRFGKSQGQVHVAFLSLCLISYFVSLMPILLGYMGKRPFVLAVLVSTALFAGYVVVMRPRLRERPHLLKTHLVYPFAAIGAIFAVLYFAHAIPPVPLSVKYLGIYHTIEKRDGEYELTFTRPRWKFWQHGDQTFLARPGDAIQCYARIYSPTRFKDRLQVRWLFDDPRRGWVTSDLIPLPVFGGREEGFRAVTQKRNYQPGRWRVQVETQDAREIGRIGFRVEADPSVDPRETHQETR